MLQIRPATSDEDLAHIARIVTTVTPDFPISVAEMRWQQERYPGGGRFLAWRDEVPVGAGGAGRAYSYPADFPGLWGNISVLPEHRRQGVGVAILAALMDLARSSGKTMLIGRTTEDRVEALEFLAHRGFVEHERMKAVRLDLAGVEPPAVEPPARIEITSLEARPDLVEAVYAVALEALPDIPGDGPMAPGTLEEFRMRDVDREVIPPGAFAVAVEAATGRVVGYANLMIVSGNPQVAWHGMTAVARAWRGRGVAMALKRATIAWAVARKLEALETANDTDNAPMRAVNQRLGYRSLPDEVYVRGPVTQAPVAAR
ncbi:MAG TPA: GNAT family N-acetyltransferase [Candidatus Limnocylindria bacterium]|nr:GNAT family N-acetyltransferase [Candidatus Limnocylindria bacterium]